MWTKYWASTSGRKELCPENVHWREECKRRKTAHTLPQGGHCCPICPHRGQEVGAWQNQLPSWRPTNQLDASFSLTDHSIRYWVLYLDLLNVSLISNCCLCGSLFHNGSAPSVLVDSFSFLDIFSTIYRVIFPRPKSDHGAALSVSLQWCLTVCRKSTASSRLLPRQAVEPAPSSFSPLPFVVLSRRAFRAGVPCLSVLLLPSVSVCTDCSADLPLTWVTSFYQFLETQLR